MQLNTYHFTPGDTVEIIKTSNFTTSFYPATVILQDTNIPNKRRKKKRNKNKKKHDDDDDDDDVDEEEQEVVFMVQYQTHFNDIVSYVDGGDIRPVPPENAVDGGGKFAVGDKVDVLRGGCWMKGRILAVMYEGSSYLVEIEGDFDVPIEVRGSFLRVHREWCHGSWIPPLEHVQKESMKIEQGNISKPGTTGVAAVRTNAKGKQVKLIFSRAKRRLEANFSPGTAVEVKSDEDGYQGSWYAAIVVGSVGVGKFLVEYQTLKTEDETELLKEVANEQDIRPCPPEIPQRDRYMVHEEVDAWYNDGWWEGAIFEVLDDWKYVVYFASTNEKLVYQHSDLRPHQNWIDGKWILAFPHKSSDFNLKSSSSERKYNQSKADRSFGKGTVFEVRSDEPGYEGSWYSAVIVCSTGKGTYLVEYLTLKSEDERNNLREEVEAQNIRPCPPDIEAHGCYLILEKVEAWYNDGWWAGVISKVLADKKYMVYFEASKEELEFDHVNLRTCQEWINGNWITPNKETDIYQRT